MCPAAPLAVRGAGPSRALPMLRQSSDLSLTRLTGYNPRKIDRRELTNMPGSAHNELWPELPYEAWKDTRETLHLWTQIAARYGSP